MNLVQSLALVLLASLGPRAGNGPVERPPPPTVGAAFRPDETVVEGALSLDVVNRVLERHHSEILHCYGRLFSEDPSLVDDVTVNLLVNHGGVVVAIDVKKPEPLSERLGDCAKHYIKQWLFPAAKKGATTIVTYPYRFEAQSK